MHEVSLSQNILNLALETAKKNNAKKICEIKLVIGEMSCINNDSLLFCFNAIAKETIAQNALIKIDRIPIKIKCKKCKREGSVEEYIFVCKHCGAREIEVVQGKELKVDYIKIE